MDDNHTTTHARGGDLSIWIAGNEVAILDALEQAFARSGINVRRLTENIVPLPSRFDGLGILVATPESDRLDHVLHEEGSARVVVVVPGPVAAADAWGMLQAGATDVLSYVDADTVVRAVAGRLQRWDMVDRWMNAPVVRRHLVGESAEWLRALRRIIEAALFARGPVLVLGETGTGKELVARLIHTLDTRPDKQQLVLLDCTTVTPELSGSEFFGHEKGAFTNAVSSRRGAFELADGGTLFLDEVGDLPIGLQAELLRVIQEKTYKRVGSHTWKSTDFRLVCATHQNLQAMLETRAFRQDLYHRIAGWTLRLPPLRERRSDVVRLARHFLRELHPTSSLQFDPTVEAVLTMRDYPGNVRELRQLVRRIGCRHQEGGIITLGDLPAEEYGAIDRQPSLASNRFRQCIRRAVASGIGMKEICRMAGDVAVDVALQDASGNVKQAATRLNVSRRTIQIRRAQMSGEG